MIFLFPNVPNVKKNNHQDICCCTRECFKEKEKVCCSRGLRNVSLETFFFLSHFCVYTFSMKGSPYWLLQGGLILKFRHWSLQYQHNLLNTINYILKLSEHMENYYEYKLSRVQARKKPNVVPHIFSCHLSIR